ncbi:MAG TPA: cation diffusion facilitator family transporter [Bacteroidota bacterium]|nr:cation diffusion facilitator family transporter [Bacteroidota bacterium]
MHNPLVQQEVASSNGNGSIAQQKLAISLSLAVGFLMLAGKSYAYAITNSAAIFSDAAESVIHVFAVAFAAFSLWLSIKPADVNHPYGHEKISYFSAGMEGMMIVLAAFYIIYEAIMKWLGGLAIQNLGTGTLYTAAATTINAFLGGYLVWQGKRSKSLILVANGKHVLTDSWTSFGVIVGLLLTIWTGWLPFDPILAILVALNILWSGGKLIRQSVGGLMDEGDPEIERQLRRALDEETQKRGLWYHELRHRHSGSSIWVEVHLLFPKGSLIEEAHWKATEVEAAVKNRFSLPIHILTHLEPREEHDEIHQQLKSAKE